MRANLPKNIMSERLIKNKKGKVKNIPYLIMGQSAQQIPPLKRVLNQIRSLSNPLRKTWKTTLRKMLKRQERKHPELVSPNLSRRKELEHPK